jgi:hypothetical protein
MLAMPWPLSHSIRLIQSRVNIRVLTLSRKSKIPAMQSTSIAAGAHLLTAQQKKYLTPLAVAGNGENFVLRLAPCL